MGRQRVGVVAMVGAITCGLPLYFALDHLRWLPLGFRDRPWPLAMVVAVAAVVTVVRAWQARRAQRGRVLAIACAMIALAAAVCFVVIIGNRYQLPPSARGLEVGKQLDFTLPDHTGHPVRLASLRGRPMLLYFYRGES